MGLEQGLKFKADQERIFGSLFENEFVPWWLKFTGQPLFKAALSLKGLTVGHRHLPTIRRFAGAQLERMEGIAAGAGVSLFLLMGLASIETMSASFQFVLGCTSLGVGRVRSKTKAPILAYNHDFPNFLKRHLFIRRSHPRGGFKSIQMTYPLMPGAICGLNSRGVAITLNHAFSTEPLNDGVPPTFMVQEALDHCRNTDEVVALFRRVKFSNGSMATVVDEHGKMVALELARGRFGVRSPMEDLSLTLNEYQLGRLREIEVPQEAKFDPKKYPDFFRDLQIHFANWERRGRFGTLLKKNKKFGPADLKKYLADHNGTKRGGIGTICRHHRTADTIASALL